MNINVDNEHIYHLDVDDWPSVYSQISSYRMLCSLQAVIQVLIFGTYAILDTVNDKMMTSSIAGYFPYISLLTYATFYLVNMYANDIKPKRKISHDISGLAITYILIKLMLMLPYLDESKSVIIIPISLIFIAFDELTALKEASRLAHEFQQSNDTSVNGDS